MGCAAVNTEAILPNIRTLTPETAKAAVEYISAKPDRSPAARIEGAGGGSSPQPKAQHDSADARHPALDLAQNVAEHLDRKLHFYRDEGTGRLAAVVVDRQSGEVVRYIPPPEMLKLAARIEEVAATLRGDTAPAPDGEPRIA